MSITPRYTSRDLELMPDVEGVRYEIIDGELHVSKMPRWEHQYSADGLASALRSWSVHTGLGIAVSTPGLVFAEDEDVAPDVVWVSRERFAVIVDDVVISEPLRSWWWRSSPPARRTSDATASSS